MLTGFAFLARMGDDYIKQQAQQHRLTELETIPCSYCDMQFRLFAADLPMDEAGDVKDLKERLYYALQKDCPKNVPEGQPARGAHPSQYEFLANGKYAV
jgi:hypothetical protein